MKNVTYARLDCKFLISAFSETNYDFTLHIRPITNEIESWSAVQAFKTFKYLLIDLKEYFYKVIPN